ncbi:MAG: hypothetical protein ACFFAQ_05300 [Promethearchaeota archaeon]
MKLLKAMVYASFILIIFIIIIPFVNADGTILYDITMNFEELVIILFFILNINIVLEYCILSALTKHKIENRKDLFRSVAAVNLFTFPTTQLLALWIAVFIVPQYWIFFYILIELIPIMLEFFLFLYIFKIVLEIVRTTNSIKIFMYTLLANLGSFIIGFFPTVFYFNL